MHDAQGEASPEGEGEKKEGSPKKEPEKKAATRSLGREETGGWGELECDADLLHEFLGGLFRHLFEFLLLVIAGPVF